MRSTPPSTTKETLRTHRRRVGRVKRFPAVLFVRVTDDMNASLHDAATAFGLGVSEYVRLVLSESLGVPDERPNLENTKGA